MADLGDGLLGAYVAATRLAGPLGRLIVGRRLRAGREHPERWPERLGRTERRPPPDRPVVWVHAASVGETVSILPLVARIAGEGAFVVLTTVTTTSADVVGARLPEGVVHQFVPVDLAGPVTRFLDRWRPRLAIFVESEMWPVALAMLDRRRVPLVIVNGRMSDRSFGRWSRVPFVARALMKRVALCLAQTPGDAERFRALGVGQVETTGNVKLDAAAPEADAATAAALAATLGGRPMFLAASTHPGEDEIVVAAHRHLAARYRDLVTVIVPRHPGRGEAIAGLVRAADLPVALRSRNEPPPATSGVYVADTVGELGTFYRLAAVALVGGSFVPVGGHNPVEAARAGTPVITGPEISNNREAFAALLAADAAAVVADADGLAAEVDRLLADPDLRARRTAAAAAAMDAATGALDRSLDALRPLLARGGRP